MGPGGSRARSRSSMEAGAKTVPGVRGDVLGEDVFVPFMYPKRYEKKASTMQWRGFIMESGKNNINRVRTSAYGLEFAAAPLGAAHIRTSNTQRQLRERERALLADYTQRRD